MWSAPEAEPATVTPLFGCAGAAGGRPTEQQLQGLGEEYAAWIARTEVADDTARTYRNRVGMFLCWLAERPTGEYDEALVDQHVRDYAVRDYRRHMLAEAKLAVSTVETSLSAIASFFDWQGLGRPAVTRTVPPRSLPKALDDAELRRVLRNAERRGPRDHALVATLFYTAVRVSEAAALDVDDLYLTDRTGRVDVRHGKGGRPRGLPVPAEARGPIRGWLTARQAQLDRRPPAGTQITTGGERDPLFLSRTGSRLSVRRMQSTLADISADTGTQLTPHVLRHTFARTFLDRGGDVGALQEMLGHRQLASTQVYTRPPASRLEELVERVSVEP